MLLGEIKLQSLSLMFPDASVPYDDSTPEGVEGAVYRLKADHNFSGLLDAAVGSINRAFSAIEERGLSGAKCADKALSLCQRSKNGVIITPNKDFLSLERLLCHRGEKTYDCAARTVENKIYTEEVGDVYTLVYREKIPRVKRITADTFEVEMANGLCEAIPYFVASELLAREDAQRSAELKNLFFEALDACEKQSAPCHQCFQIIYAME